MPTGLPLTPGRAPLIRTDFTDNGAWASLVLYLLTERNFPDMGEFIADVEPIDDPQFEGLAMDELLELAPNEDASFDDETGETRGGPTVYSGDGSVPKLHTHAYVADSMTFTHPERPILAVNFYLNHGEHFRLTAASMVPVETNLGIANLGFDDYMGLAELQPDGILRDTSFD